MQIIIIGNGKHDLVKQLARIERGIMALQEQYDALSAKIDAIGSGLEGLGVTISSEASEVGSAIAELKQKISELNEQIGSPVDFSPLLSRLDASVAKIADLGSQVAGFVEPEEKDEAPIVVEPVE